MSRLPIASVLICLWITVFTGLSITVHPVAGQGTPIAVLPTMTEIHQVEWHPAGQVLAVASSDGLQLYDPALQLVIHLHAGERIYGLSWHPNGHQLALTYQTGLEIWDWDVTHHTLTLTRTLPGGNTQIGAFWSPDGARIASIEAEANDTGWYGPIHFWSTATWQSERLSNDLFDFDNDPNGSRLAWSRVDPTQLLGVGQVVTFENGILIGQTNPIVYVIDARTGIRVRDIPLLGNGSTAVALSPHGDLFTIGLLPGVDLYSYTSGEFVRAFGLGTVHNVDWSPNGRYVVGDTLIVDVTAQQEIGQFARQTGIAALDWHPNGRWLAIADRDGLLKIEDAGLLPGFVVPSTPTPTFTPTRTPTPTPTFTPTPTVQANVNLVTNGDFNQGTTGWAVSNGAAQVVDGATNRALAFSRSTGTPDGGVFQTINQWLPADTRLELTVEMRNPTTVAKSVNLMLRASSHFSCHPALVCMMLVTFWHRIKASSNTSVV